MGILKSTKKAKEAMAVVTEESAKSEAAKDIINSLNAPEILDKTEITFYRCSII